MFSVSGLLLLEFAELFFRFGSFEPAVIFYDACWKEALFSTPWRRAGDEVRRVGDEVYIFASMAIIIPLSEGSFTIDKTKIFVPFKEEQDDLQKRATGSLLVEVQPFCLVTKKDIILIDTGLGFSKNGKLQIHTNLIENGIQPEAVTKVLLSHLHKDHAGGISRQTITGRNILAFPNATYYVQKREFDYAERTSYPSFVTEEFEGLADSPQVHWLNEDKGTIEGFIRYEVTGAHSPYHQVFWITDDGATYFFGADDAPQLGQMKSRFIAKYDYDGKKCMELRHQWWQQGNKEGWIFLFYHDVKAPIYTPL